MSNPDPAIVFFSASTVAGFALVVGALSGPTPTTPRGESALPAVRSTAVGIHPDREQEGLDRLYADMVSVYALADRLTSQSVLDQVTFPPEPIGLLEVDTYGNILIPVEADALVTHDGIGEPVVAGPDLRGSRCARSVAAVLERTAGPFTVVCLPREYGLYERLHGRTPEAGSE